MEGDESIDRKTYTNIISMVWVNRYHSGHGKKETVSRVIHTMDRIWRQSASEIGREEGIWDDSFWLGHQVDDALVVAFRGMEIKEVGHQM